MTLWGKSDPITKLLMNFLWFVLIVGVLSGGIVTLIRLTYDKEESNTLSKDLSQCTVVDVLDSITIVVHIGNIQETVRLIGVELSKSTVPDADEFVKESLLNKPVSLEFDRKGKDEDNRLYAYVYLNGALFNKTLLEKGYLKYKFDLSTMKYNGKLQDAEREARGDKVGIWADND